VESRFTEKDYEKLEFSSWQTALYTIKGPTPSITADGLVRADHLIVAVAHALQPTNKAAGGTKASRYVAVGQRVTAILASLRFTIWAGGATRGQSATQRRMKNQCDTPQLSQHLSTTIAPGTLEYM
jgi:hypothetical protein